MKTWVATILVVGLFSVFMFPSGSNANDNVFSVQKFKKRIIGNNKLDVKKLIGAPTEVLPHGNDETGEWIYGSCGSMSFGEYAYGKYATSNAVVVDAESDKTPRKISIIFVNGVVSSVILECFWKLPEQPIYKPIESKGNP